MITTMTYLQVARDLFDSGHVAASYKVMDLIQPDYEYVRRTSQWQCILRRHLEMFANRHAIIRRNANNNYMLHWIETRVRTYDPTMIALSWGSMLIRT